MKTVIVYGLKNVVGGIENYLINMHKYLHNDLNFVFFVEETESFIYDRVIRENGGEVVFLPERHNISEYTKSFRKLLRDYSKTTNKIYINVGHISFDIIPIRISLSEGYEVITHSHSAMQEPIKQLSYRVRQKILRSIGTYRLNHLNSIERLAVSKRSGDFLYHRKPYKIVPPGIEVEKFIYNEQKRKEVRNKYGLSDSIVLGFVGRLVAVKNPLFLIDVLCGVQHRIPNAKLLIVGDGELKDDIKDKATDKGVTNDIIFAGETNTVEDFYQAMDVLVAPSLSEGMPLNIMEAQSSGVPCICSKNNFPEAIDVTGLVRFCSLESGVMEWCNALCELVNNRIDRCAINDLVKDSDYNIINASKKLLDVLI